MFRHYKKFFLNVMRQICFYIAHQGLLALRPEVREFWRQKRKSDSSRQWLDDAHNMIAKNEYSKLLATRPRRHLLITDGINHSCSKNEFRNGRQNNVGLFVN